jgi:hypothetical protein
MKITAAKTFLTKMCIHFCRGQSASAAAALCILATPRAQNSRDHSSMQSVQLYGAPASSSLDWEDPATMDEQMAIWGHYAEVFFGE